MGRLGGWGQYWWIPIVILILICLIRAIIWSYSSEEKKNNSTNDVQVPNMELGTYTYRGGTYHKE